MPLSTQVYTCMGTGELDAGKGGGGQPCDGQASHPGGSRNTPSGFSETKS